MVNYDYKVSQFAYRFEIFFILSDFFVQRWTMDPKSVRMPNVIRARVIVVGESQIGKTALCRQVMREWLLHLPSLDRCVNA